MAKLTEVQYKEKYEKEKKRLEAIERKKELAKQKKELSENYLQNKYGKVLDGEEIRANLVDIVDLDDMIPKAKAISSRENDYRYYKDLNEFEKNRKEEYEKLEKDINFKDSIPERKLSEQQLAYINQQNSDIKTYFQNISPKYDYYICSCCGIPKPLNEFHKIWSPLFANKMDLNGVFHASWCRDCARKLFEYYYRKYNCNAEYAMERFCCDTNTYWDIDYFKKAQENMDKNNLKNHIVSEYLVVLGKERIFGRTYWDSPTIKNRNITIIHGEDNEFETKLIYDPEVLEEALKNGLNVAAPIEVNTKDTLAGAPLHWTKEDAQNKLKIVKIIGYDPWNYLEDKDKKVIYKDFLNILELGMEEDFTKLQAAIQIVNSFFKIRNMEEEFARKQKENAPVNELKTMSDLLKKERDSISNFTRDQGFSERYSASKAKGENTLSGMLNKMNNAQYEKVLLNAYDIETSKSMQQVADISFQAVMKQINLSDSEVWQVCQNQLVKIKNLQKELDKTKEELRLANYQIAENNLKKEAKKRGDDV